ncbi:MAG: response regulator transcription factor [Ignavibacteriales bacterium]|nr:response regulator transcription factor [Ignavibacteriales bacterium]
MIKAKIIIFDKSPIVFHGITAILEKNSVFSEILCEQSFKELVSLIKKNDTDLLIVNTHLLEKDQLKNLQNNISKNSIKIIVLNSNQNHPDQEDLQYNEIITFCENEDQIIKKITSCIGGEKQKKQKHAKIISSREESILREIALGLSNKEIAEKLFISQHTVITHRKNITRKLGIKSVSGLTIYAILNKLISLNEAE